MPLDLLAVEDALVARRPGQMLIGDKNYFGCAFERELAEQGIQLLRAAPQGTTGIPAPSCSTLRQIIESLKGQLDLEHHRGRTPDSVIIRIMQRILALTAAI